MVDQCVAVFTARSPHRILKEGGSQAWALDANRARKATYLVCIQNQHNPDRDFSDASEAHGMAFLIGKISDVIPAPEDPDCGRWQICISEYARIKVADAWKGWRNPVHYTSLEKLDIQAEQLTFRPVMEADDPPPPPEVQPLSADMPRSKGQVAALSMAEAKPALAAFYGVTSDAIEIVIRG